MFAEGQIGRIKFAVVLEDGNLPNGCVTEQQTIRENGTCG